MGFCILCKTQLGFCIKNLDLCKNQIGFLQISIGKTNGFGMFFEGFSFRRVHEYGKLHTHGLCPSQSLFFDYIFNEICKQTLACLHKSIFFAKKTSGFLHRRISCLQKTIFLQKNVCFFCKRRNLSIVSKIRAQDIEKT